MFFDPYTYHGTSFEQTYRCYPASFIEKVGLLFLFLFCLWCNW
uniref:Ubiquitin fusion degradaton protein n=1 Tax=Rhizophora mucronata TaxID=61149 RepID=A0A2P2J5I0_RHIMU